MAQPEDILEQEAGNPGETLRQAREAQGWSVNDVAGKMNLTVQRVKEVEEGAFDKIPGHTFARGYVRSYAKLLGLPQEELVAEFDRYTHTDSGGSPVHSLNGVEKLRKKKSGKSSKVGLLIFLLLIAAGAAYYWWQQPVNEAVSEAILPTRTMPEHVEVDSADGTTQIHSLLGAEDNGNDQEAQQGGAQPLTLPGTDEGSIEIVTPNEPSATDAASQAETATATEAPELTMTFSDNCWVQVNDAEGNLMVREEKKAGDVLTLTGEAPFQVRLGYANAVSMSYNGTAVDIQSHVRGQTANMTVGGE